MRMMRIAMLLTCGVALLSCDDSTSPDPTRGDPGGTARLPLNLSSAAGGIIESVTGYGAIRQPPGSFFLLQQIRFTALRYADGTVTGEFERRGQFQILSMPVTTTVLHGSVTCFKIVENRAVIGGVIEHSVLKTAGLPPEVGLGEGGSINWEVADNGEGANDPPDEISGSTGAGPPPGEQTQCARGPTETTFPVEEGNIQIHPEPQP